MSFKRISSISILAISTPKSFGLQVSYCAGIIFSAPEPLRALFAAVDDPLSDVSSSDFVAERDGSTCVGFAAVVASGRSRSSGSCGGALGDPGASTAEFIEGGVEISFRLWFAKNPSDVVFCCAVGG